MMELVVVVVGKFLPIPNCLAFSWAALEAIWAASRESWGTERVAIVSFCCIVWKGLLRYVMFSSESFFFLESGYLILGVSQVFTRSEDVCVI